MNCKIFSSFIIVGCLLLFTLITLEVNCASSYHQHSNIGLEEVYDFDTAQSKARYDPRQLSEELNSFYQRSEEDAAFCLSNHIRYNHGQKIYRADPCEICVCVDGEIFCWWKKCEHFTKNTAKKKFKHHNINNNNNNNNNNNGNTNIHKYKKSWIKNIPENVLHFPQNLPFHLLNTDDNLENEKKFVFKQPLLLSDITKTSGGIQLQSSSASASSSLLLNNVEKTSINATTNSITSSSTTTNNNNNNNNIDSTTITIDDDANDADDHKIPSENYEIPENIFNSNVPTTTVINSNNILDTNKTNHFLFYNKTISNLNNNEKIDIPNNFNNQDKINTNDNNDNINNNNINSNIEINNLNQLNTDNIINNEMENLNKKNIDLLMDDIPLTEHYIITSSGKIEKQDTLLLLENNQENNNNNQLLYQDSLLNDFPNYKQSIINPIQSTTTTTTTAPATISDNINKNNLDIMSSIIRDENSISATPLLSSIVTSAPTTTPSISSSDIPTSSSASSKTLTAMNFSMKNKNNNKSMDATAVEENKIMKKQQFLDTSDDDTIEMSTTENSQILYCIVMGERYNVGTILPRETGNCLECICSNGTNENDQPRVTCSPHNCPPLILPDLFDATGY